jgi:uncharacterized protein YndB with AHSA1/START domain
MTELTITRTLAAPQERVWHALTKPEELAAWFWPGAWNVVATVDLRVGGRYRISSAPAGMAFGGEYLAIEPIDLLRQTWQWDGDDHETLVTIRLTPDGLGTTLEIVHERFTSDEDVANHLQGWNDCLDRLPAFVGD